MALIKPGNHPIHPIGAYYYSDGEFDIEVRLDGLTKREYFAGLVFQQFLHGARLPPGEDAREALEFVAQRAVESADILLAELAKESVK